MSFGILAEKFVDIKKYVEFIDNKIFGKRCDHVLSKKLTRTHPEELLVEISTIKLEKFRKKKSKMMKIRMVINSDVEVVAHPEVVQNTFETLKLSIFDHISSLK